MAKSDAVAVAGRPNSIDELDMERGACVLAPKYSATLVRARALDGPGETLKTLARGVEIVTAAGVFVSGLILDNFRKTEDVVSRSEQLRVQLAELGPSFVKAGQVLANRPDIVRADYMDQLTKLQDDVPPFANPQAFDIMEQELGRPISEVYSEISSEPIAAASLGQVYRGRLRATGEEVAIKVQRPGIEPIIYRDLVLFRALAAFVNQVSMRRLGPTRSSSWTSSGRSCSRSSTTCRRGGTWRSFTKTLTAIRWSRFPSFIRGRAERGCSRWSGSTACGARTRRGSGRRASTSTTSSASA